LEQSKLWVYWINEIAEVNSASLDDAALSPLHRRIILKSNSSGEFMWTFTAN
jgi:hypothetical protein